MMDKVIVADKQGKELRFLLFDTYDFEVGREENDFQIEIRREEYEYIPPEARIYIPGTELGGLFRQLDTNTEQGTIAVGGLTWRGMMTHKIIQPPAGQDYATDSGELNAIIKARVEAEFPDLFKGTTESTGVTVSWQYDRYCTMEEGLQKLLQSVGYRLDIAYSEPDNAVIVQAVPIVDYSDEVEFSSDMRANYTMQQQGDGVNHLICLGKGELKNRLVRHLYIDEDGNVSQTQYYFGVDEIAEVYDNSGAEADDLIQGGTERLKTVANKDVFSIKVDPEIEVAIGDIVGGRDYLSGMTMTAPVWSKIIKYAAGAVEIEYVLEEDRMTIEETPERIQTIADVRETLTKLEEPMVEDVSIKTDAKTIAAIVSEGLKEETT